MFDVLTYVAWAVGVVLLGGGIIGLGLILLWLGVAVLAWDATRPEVL